LKTPYTDIPMDETKRFRDKKKPVVIALEKYELKPFQFHCPVHLGTRLLRTKNSWLCPLGCGPTGPMTRTVMAI
jgi:hypothetical protein